MARLLPSASDASHYRFPAQGRSYIEVPHEAFRSQGEHARRWPTASALCSPPPCAAVSQRRAAAPPAGLACSCRGAKSGRSRADPVPPA